MKSHSNSRHSPTLGARQRERRTGLPSPAIARSASELRRECCLMRPAQELRATDHQSLSTIHQLPIPHFLIASHQLLEIRVTCSQQTRKDFLIASFYCFLAHPRHLAEQSRLRAIVFSQRRPHVGDSCQLARHELPNTRRDSLRLRIRRTSAKLGPCENYPTLR